MDTQSMPSWVLECRQRVETQFPLPEGFKEYEPGYVGIAYDRFYKKEITVKPDKVNADIGYVEVTDDHLSWVTQSYWVMLRV